MKSTHVDTDLVVLVGNAFLEVAYFGFLFHHINDHFCLDATRQYSCTGHCLNKNATSPQVLQDRNIHPDVFINRLLFAPNPVENQLI